MLDVAVRLLRLAVPIAAGRIGIVGMGIVDLVVVGHFAPDELALLAMGLTVTGPVLLGGIGLMLGVQILTARALGEGSSAAARLVWRRGLVIGAIAGLATWIAVATLAVPLWRAVGVAGTLFAAAPIASVLALSIPLHLAFVATTYYLEGLQRPVPGAVAMWVANGVNLALNLLLVPEWGALGSAWTTVGSRLFLLVALIGYAVLRVPNRGERAALPTSGYGELLRIGVPAALSGLVEAAAFAMMAMIAARLDAASIATFNVATGGLLTLVSMIAAGFGAAGAVLVANATGRSDRNAARAAGWIAIGVNGLVFVAIGLICFFAATPIAALFTSNAAVIVTFAAVMWMNALLMTPDCGQMVVDRVVRAYGENWFPTFARVLCFVFVAPALAYWLVEVRGSDVAGVFAALTIASMLAFAALLARWAVVSRNYTART